MSSTKWFVYIVQTEKGLLYTGITTEPERRISEHQNSPKGAKFLRGKGLLRLVFLKEGKNRSEVSKLEARIKKLRRDQKEKLIRGDLVL